MTHSSRVVGGSVECLYYMFRSDFFALLPHGDASDDCDSSVTWPLEKFGFIDEVGFQDDEMGLENILRHNKSRDGGIKTTKFTLLLSKVPELPSWYTHREPIGVSLTKASNATIQGF